jgi:hypothetical protein
VVPLDDLARPLFADEARSHVLNRLPLPYSFTE